MCIIAYLFFKRNALKKIYKKNQSKKKVKKKKKKKKKLISACISFLRYIPELVY
jgi:hypothetical protein